MSSVCSPSLYPPCHSCSDLVPSSSAGAQCSLWRPNRSITPSGSSPPLPPRCSPTVAWVSEHFGTAHEWSGHVSSPPDDNSPCRRLSRSFWWSWRTLQLLPFCVGRPRSCSSDLPICSTIRWDESSVFCLHLFQFVLSNRHWFALPIKHLHSNHNPRCIVNCRSQLVA